jgi:hypothetical protein
MEANLQPQSTSRSVLGIVENELSSANGAGRNFSAIGHHHAVNYIKI